VQSKPGRRSRCCMRSPPRPEPPRSNHHRPLHRPFLRAPSNGNSPSQAGLLNDI
jgi:hypothetical protein